MSTIKPALWDADSIVPRQRVISDNDYAGDPDGLVQLAHLLLSPSVDVRGVIASHLGVDDPFSLGTQGFDASRGAERAATIAELCGRSDVPIATGFEGPLTAPRAPRESAGAHTIVREAMRDDSDTPLFVTCGGSLTEVADAWTLEPRIAGRFTLIWIGGHEYPSVAEPPPGGGDMEYNTGLDPIAAQILFNDSDIDIWQVPRSTYRTAIASRSELRRRMMPAGPLGDHLYRSLGGVVEFAASKGHHLGETYVLGDSPLVLLTALWTGFEPGPASSPWITRPCPRIEDSGLYAEHPHGRLIRVFTGLDNRLMMEDLFAKLDELAGLHVAQPSRNEIADD